MAIHAAGGITGSATSTGSFGNIDITGDAIIHGTLTAREMAISSSVTNVTTLAISGSSKFGDSIDDKHQMTGSLLVTGSIGVNQTSPASLIHVKAKTTSDDAGITWSSAHPYNWSIGLDAGAGHYFKITNSDTPGGGTDYMSFGGQSVTFPSGVTQINMLADNIYIGNAIRHYGEADVSIEMTSNQIEFQADDQSMILTPNHLSGSSTNPKGFSGSFNHVIVANKITGSAISTGSFGKLLGDGSDLSGVSGFPFTGSAGISGSLKITHQGRELFNIQDNFNSANSGSDQILFSVNNIAGAPVLQAEASRSRVLIGGVSGLETFFKPNGDYVVQSSSPTSASFEDIVLNGTNIHSVFINEGDIVGFPFTASHAGGPAKAGIQGPVEVTGSILIETNSANSGSSLFRVKGNHGNLLEATDNKNIGLFRVPNLIGFDALHIDKNSNITFDNGVNPQVISGSAFSTSSFGRTEVADVLDVANKIEVGSSGDELIFQNGLLQVGLSNSALAGGIHVRNTPQNGVAIFESGDANVNIMLKDSAGQAYLQYAGSGQEWYFSNANFYLTPTKVSGSATSTGSFGQVKTDAVLGTIGGTSALAIQKGAYVSGNTKGAYFNLLPTNNAYVSIVGDSDYHLHEWNNLSSTGKFVNAAVNGTMVFEIDGKGSVSGSSTSTGSFGDLKIGAVASGQLYSSFSSSIASRVASAAAGGVSFNGSTANGLVTYGGTTTADVESGLTYTGAGGELSVSGDLVVRDTTSTHIRIDAPTNYDSSLIFAENAQDRWYLWHEADNDRLEFYVTGDNPGATSAAVLFKLHPTGHFEVAGANAKISGSATSTGSFGKLEVPSGKVLGKSTSAVSIPFSITGGTSAAAGGLQFGAYDANFGGIWSGAVTPAAGNYALVASATRTVINADTDIGFYLDDATVLTFMNSTGVAIGGSTTPAYKLDVGGTGRFTGTLTTAAIHATGLGIGETTLDHKLDIHGTGYGTSAAAIKLSGDDGSHHWAAIKFADSNTDKWGLVSDVNANNSHNIAFYNYASNKIPLIIDGSNDNVGIGTETPNTPLHTYQGTVGNKIAVFQTVSSGHTQGITIGSGTNGSNGKGLHIGYGQQIDNGYIDAYDWTNSAYKKIKINDYFTFNAQSGFGINQATPAYKLDVTGDGRFTTNLTVGGNIVAQGDITAQRLIVSSSVTNMVIAEKSGSTAFGDDIADKHQFTGSLNTSGSANVLGHLQLGGNIEPTGLTGEYFYNLLSLKNASNAGMTFERLGSSPKKIQIGLHSSGDFRIIDTQGTDVVRFAIKDGGNVGIGSTDPAKFLDVVAADGIADNNNVARFYNAEATAGRNYGVQIRGGSNATDTALDIYDVANTNLFIIKGDGKVGINTSSPTTKLNVVGTTKLSLHNQTASDRLLGLEGHASQTGNAIEYFKSGGSVLFNVNQDGKLAVGTSATVGQADAVFYAYGHMHIRDNYQFVWGTNINSAAIQGNASTNTIKIKVDTNRYLTWNATGLGVNTQSPAHKLHVVGDGRFTTNLLVDGNVSGSATSTGSFGKLLGDGSEITGISTTPFPFTGSANISGSVDVKHLGAATGSTILSVQGSEGTLFSVVNSMTGSIFSANTTAGIPVIEAFSNGDVHIGPSGSSFAKLYYNGHLQSSGSSGGGGGSGTGFPFTGSAGLSGSLEVKHLGAATGSTLLDVVGSEGTLFSVVNSMTGSIFSANTTAGIPVIEAFSDGKVEFGPLTKVISGSSTSTGSFGRVEATKLVGDGSGITGLSGLAVSNNADNRVVTGDGTNLNAETALTFNGTQLDLSSAGHATVHITGASGKDANLKLQNNSRLWIWQNDGDNTLAKGAGALHLHDGTVGASRIIVNSTGLVEVPGGVSGSATSTGSFGDIQSVRGIGIGLGSTGYGSTQRSIYTKLSGHNAVRIESVSGDPSIEFVRSSNEKYYIQHEAGGLNHKYTSGGGSYPSYMFVDNSTNIGLGTTSPVAKLHVYTGDSGFDATTNGDELFIESSGHAGMTIGSGTTSQGNIFFGDSGDPAVGIIRYDHNTNLLQMGAGGSSTHLIINASGNVGIGTASPAQKLHVYGASDTFHRTDAGASSGIQYQFWHGGTQTATINSNTTNIFSVYDGAAGATNVFNIKDGGNVGIGVASPVDKLHVAGNIRATGNIIAQNYIVSSSVTHMTQSFSSGSTIFGDTVTDTHKFTGSLDIVMSGSDALTIEGNTGPLFKVTDVAGDSLFTVTDVSGVPAFDIDNEYKVEMGNPADPLLITKDSSGNTIISGSATSTAKFGQFTEASSIAFKTNVETLENPLDKISKLRGVTYNLKANNEPSIGMIAEEVNEVFPELVDKDDSGNPQAMSYTRMTAVLLEAVKELTEEVKELKKSNIYNKYKDKK